MTIKLIALDIDGTLLDDEHRIGEKNLRTIRRVAEQGVKVVLCTGRGAMSARPVMEELALEGVMITHNGASILDTKDNILYEDTFQVTELADLIRILPGTRHSLRYQYFLGYDRRSDVGRGEEDV